MFLLYNYEDVKGGKNKWQNVDQKLLVHILEKHV